MTIEEAEAILAPFPEYAVLRTSGRQFFTTTEIATQLRLSPSVVRRLCEDGSLSGAVFYDAFIGWRVPRSSVLIYVASAIRARQSDAS